MVERIVRVLLIDGQIEDSRWVQELLAELAEGRFGGGWMHGIDVFPLDRLADALVVLGDRSPQSQFDAVLLNPNLPDSMGLHSYLRVQAQAPDVPVIILAEMDDPDLANSMIRAGAQDFLAKPELDSIPLARAIRLAVERFKLVRDLRTHVSRDELTALANRNGFDLLAERDLAAARHLERSLAMLLVEVTGLEELAQSYGRGEQQLALLELAELLRSCAGRSACVGRIAPERFAISLLPVDAAEGSTLAALLTRKFHLLQMSPSRQHLRIRMGMSWYHGGSRGAMATPGGEHITIADLLASAAQMLCENKMEIPGSMVEKNNHLTAIANRTRRNV